VATDADVDRRIRCASPSWSPIVSRFLAPSAGGSGRALAPSQDGEIAGRLTRGLPGSHGRCWPGAAAGRVVGSGGGDLVLAVEMEAAIPARGDSQPVTPVVTPLPERRAGRPWRPHPLARRLHELLLVSRPSGASPEPPVVSRFELTDERGRLALVQWPYIPPMPPQPLRRWQWFHLPAIPHLADHWLWYLYASGQPPAVSLAVAAPLLTLGAGLAVAAGLCWWQLRQPGAEEAGG
jgi:hypothetical protein